MENIKEENDHEEKGRVCKWEVRKIWGEGWKTTEEMSLISEK